jgi:amino acid permease
MYRICCPHCGFHSGGDSSHSGIVSLILQPTFRSHTIQPTQSYAAGRTSITLIIGFCVLLPLCLLRNLSSLKFSSVAGVVSMVFASCVVISYFSDDQRQNLPASTIAQLDGGVFTAMSLISVAFTMHYNAQRYYQELVDRSLRRISRIIFGSFAFAFLLYAFVGVFGVIEFGEKVQSNIINDFPPAPLISATRIFLSLAIIASFPLPFHGCRGNFLRLFFRLEGDDLPTSRWVCPVSLPRDHITRAHLRDRPSSVPRYFTSPSPCIPHRSPQVFCTLALFIPVIGISLATDNVGVVLSFKGSCLSSLVVYIIPGLAYIRLMQPSGYKALFGPLLLIVYGTGAVPSCARLLHSYLIISPAAVYGIVGTYFAVYNLSKGQDHA